MPTFRYPPSPLLPPPCLFDTRTETGEDPNKHVRDWPDIFAGDEILTTAILDRLLYHVHIIHIDGRCYRLRELDGLLAHPDHSPPRKGGEKTTP